MNVRCAKNLGPLLAQFCVARDVLVDYALAQKAELLKILRGGRQS
jgi:hypothetical protein